LLEWIGDACHAESRRLLDGGDFTSPDGRAEEAMRELHEQLQHGLREHAVEGPSRTAVLGTLLLQAENLWSEAVRGARRR
jgi:hypothetical protein